MFPDWIAHAGCVRRLRSPAPLGFDTVFNLQTVRWLRRSRHCLTSLRLQPHSGRTPRSRTFPEGVRLPPVSGSATKRNNGLSYCGCRGREVNRARNPATPEVGHCAVHHFQRADRDYCERSPHACATRLQDDVPILVMSDNELPEFAALDRNPGFVVEFSVVLFQAGHILTNTVANCVPSSNHLFIPSTE